MKMETGTTQQKIHTTRRASKLLIVVIIYEQVEGVLWCLFVVVVIEEVTERVGKWSTV